MYQFTHHFTARPERFMLFKGQQHNCKPSPQGKEPEVSDVSSICLNPDNPQERLPSIPESEVPGARNWQQDAGRAGPLRTGPQILTCLQE